MPNVTRYALPVNFTSMSQVMTYMNTISNNLFWNLFILSTFIISLVTFRSFRIEQSMGASFFICFVLSLFLLPYGLINESVIIMCVIGLGATAVYMYKN